VIRWPIITESGGVCLARLPKGHKRMRLGRDLTTKLHFIFDNFLPPFVRDSKVFMYAIFWLLFKKKSKIFIDFRDKKFPISDDEFRRLYEEVQDVLIKRDTDLNDGCFEAILKNVKGQEILEAGCGKCVLSIELSKKGYNVTASDIIINKDIKKKYGMIRFKHANAEKLPFRDKSFDTVICAHTLEHVQNINQAIRELRRVSSKRLIIVVPRQRPYKYTFDLHLHFFPYESNFLTLMGKNENTCKIIGGDIFYVEDL
jgi:ubiquinone/menaquinone biosynthesis C-methylase UbiE